MKTLLAAALMVYFLSGCAPQGGGAGVTPAAFPNQPIGCPNGMPSLSPSCCDNKGKQIRFDKDCGGFTRDAKPMAGIMAGAAQAATAGNRAIASANELVGDTQGRLAAATSANTVAQKTGPEARDPIETLREMMKQKPSASGAAGGGGAMIGGGGAGAGGVRDTAPAGNAPAAQMTAETNAAGSAYGGGGGGRAGAGGGTADLFPSGGLVANNGTIEMHKQDKYVEPMLTADPNDYFQRVPVSENIFKVVERRYRKTENSWATSGADSLRRGVAR